MTKRFLALLSLFFVLSVWQLSARASAQDGASDAASLTDIPEGAARLLELVNGERTDRGLARLSFRDDVSGIAWAFTRKMATRGEIWHNQDYFTAESRERLQAATLGENVAFNRSVDDAHARLMASSAHRENILNGAFTVVGIGVVRDNRGMLFITQDFLAPRSARQAVAPAPPAPAPAAPTPPAPPVPAPPPPVAPAPPGAAPPVAEPVPAPPPPPAGEGPSPVPNPGGPQVEPAPSPVLPWILSAAGIPVGAGGAWSLRRRHRQGLGFAVQVA